MAGKGCKGGSEKPQAIPTEAPPQSDDELPLVEEDDGSSSEGEFAEDSEGEFDDEDSEYEESEEDENGDSMDEDEYEEDENGDSIDEDDGEEGELEGENELELPEGFYAVEAVRKKRVRQGEPQYLIKWVGWPETSNTWEPMENLLTCSDVIDEFEESLRKKKRRKCSTHTQTKKMLQQQQHSFVVTKNNVSAVDNNVDGMEISDADGGVHEISGATNGQAEFDTKLCESKEPGRLTGAKKRKSGPPKRFIGVPSTAGVIDDGMPDAMVRTTHHNVTAPQDSEDDYNNFTEIVKAVTYPTCSWNGTGVPDVEVHFLVKRSNGRVAMMNNQFLKKFHPHLLVKFYEKQFSK